MSTQLGTLQRTRFGHLIRPVVVIALIVAVSVALVVTALGRDAAREDSNSGVREGSTNGVVSANTPSEMRAAFGGVTTSTSGTLANTPTEMRAAAGTGERPASVPSPGGTGPARFHPLP